MNVVSVQDSEFRKYGKVLQGYDCTKLIKEMEHMPLPEGVIYEPSIVELEKLEVAEQFQKFAFGNLPIQIGYCNGHNQKLNALEYHRSSEINVAVTDMILLLGLQQDIKEDYTYDTSLVKAFLVPAGTVIEVYATTLHYAPCGVDNAGFKAVVILPKGTNFERKFDVDKDNDNFLMTHQNKWLIAHEDAKIEGAFNGLKGQNITV